MNLATGAVIWLNMKVSSDSPASIAGENLFVVNQLQAALLDARTGNVMLQTKIRASSISVIAPDSVLVADGISGVVSLYKIK